MKKLLFNLIFTTTFLFVVFYGKTQSVFDSGDGSSISPYIITTSNQLRQLALYVNTGNGIYNDKYYELGNDIDLTAYGIDFNGGSGWTSIGIYHQDIYNPLQTIDYPFKGNFNGMGYKVTALFINNPLDGSNQGLFGYIKNATISNLSIIDCNIIGYDHVGGLVGYINNSEIINCFVSGNIKADNIVAALVGGSYNNSNISNCYANGNLIGVDDVGGLIGKNNYSTIQNSYAIGKIIGTGSNVGGLVGNNSNSNLTNCYSTGLVSGTLSNIGAFIGQLIGSTITTCFFDEETSGQTNGVGGGGSQIGVTALTTAQMKQQANFSSWNFTTIWQNLENLSYPFFKNQTTQAQNPIVKTSFITFEHTNQPNCILLLHNHLGTIISNFIQSTDIINISGNYYKVNYDSQVGDIIEIIVFDGAYSSTFMPSLPVSPITVSVFCGGNGTQLNPYKICDADGLNEIRNYLNSYFQLDNDIDLNEYLNNGGAGFAIWNNYGWKPIANNVNKFQGHLDGAGYKITNLYINRPTNDYVGLFGYTDAATIENLGVNITTYGITGQKYVGGLVGYNNNSTITNCYTNGNIIGTLNIVGGLVGYNLNYSTIENCYSTGNVSGNGSVGALVGQNQTSLISMSYASGNVYNNDNYTGGLIGINSFSTVENCYALGNVYGEANYVGGFSGTNETTSTITNCYAAGYVNGTGSYVAGFVGQNNAGIIDSFFDNQKSEQIYGIGGSANQIGVNAISTEEMQNINNYQSVNWNFSSIWDIWNGKSYPYFIKQSAPIYNLIAKPFNISFKLKNNADSLLIKHYNNGNISSIILISNPQNPLTAGLNIINYNSEPNDIIEIIVFENQSTNPQAFLQSYRVTTHTINPFCGGTGIESDPYLICEAVGLDEIRFYLNNPNIYFQLKNDIDLSEYLNIGGNGYAIWEDAAWKPIGDYTNIINNNPFKGKFNGAGNKIIGLQINRSSMDFVALFGYTDGAIIDSLGLVDCDIIGNNYVGLLVGSNNNSYITNSYGIGNITGSLDVGGLIGLNNDNSKIINCYAIGNVKGTQYVGGLVGSNWNTATISNSYAMVNIIEIGSSNTIGGLVGYNDNANITNCYANGNVSGIGSEIGGLVGKNNATIIASFFDIETTGQTNGIGTGIGDVIGLNTSDMKMLITYQSENWDFETTPVWAIWEEKSYPYFNWQSSPVYIQNTTPSEIIFELQNTADSVIVTHYRDGNIINILKLQYLQTQQGINTFTYNTIHGDILRFIVYEQTLAPSYPVESIIHIFCGGSGIETDPYLICNAEALNEVRNHLDAGIYFELTDNIELTTYISSIYNDEGWKAIGDNVNKFQGKFNGAEHKITGLWINSPATNGIGLFGFTENAEIKNIGVEIATDGIIGNLFIGGLVGESYNSKIENCYANGNAIGIQFVGGLVGFNNEFSNIANCYANVNVTGIEDIGGLTGLNKNSTITNCYSTGNVVGTEEIGGFVGSNSYLSTIEKCYATGYVSGIGSYVGGLTGNNLSIITNSFFDKETTGQETGYTTSGVTALATNQMKTINTYQSESWDFTTPIWQIWENNSYAYLKYQATPAYNLLATTTEFSFYLKYDADSILVVHHSNGTISKTFYNNNNNLFEGSTNHTINNIYPFFSGDTIEILVYEHNVFMPSYPIKTTILPFCGGQGTEQFPFLICDAIALDKIHNYLGDTDIFFKLNTDININTYSSITYANDGWLPIGNNTNAPNSCFRGKFNGAGHKITGLWINRNSMDFVALFGYTDAAFIDSLGVEVASNGIIGNDYVGSLVGYTDNSHISNCYAKGNIKGNIDVGGLVGNNNNSNLTNCYTTGKIIGNTDIGGLVGLNNLSVIENCYSKGNVEGSSNFVGGLVGNNESGSSITNSYASGQVSGIPNNVGGLVGNNTISTITACFFDKETTGQTDGIGGGGSQIGVTALNTIQMQDLTNYQSLNWDIMPPTIWQIWNQNSYPYFANQAAPVSNLITASQSIYFDLLNYADSIQINHYSNGLLNISWLYNQNSATNISVSGFNFLIGDTIELIVYEPYVFMPSYPVITITSTSCGGNGTQTNPFLICNAEDLDMIRINLNPNLYYKLNNNIDITDYISNNYNTNGWLPIGNSTTPFKGHFNGNGHKITGLKINRSTTDYIALFGYIYDATIENLGIEISPDAVIGRQRVGGLAGHTENSEINNCFVIGNIIGNSNYVGGLIGYNINSNIENCFVSGKIHTNSNFAGGLVGRNENTNIKNCYSTGNVNASYYVGGLVSWNENSTIENCYAVGKITGINTCGGLVGQNTGSIIGCFFDKETTGQTNGVGNNPSEIGIIALNTEDLQNITTYISVDWNINPPTTWQIWNEKSYAYFTDQAAPVYNLQAKTYEITFELYNQADSILIIRNSGGIVSQQYFSLNNNNLAFSIGYNTINYASLVGDIIELIVYESGVYMPSYSVKTLTTPFCNGNGSQNYPFIICTAEQLDSVRNYLNISNIYFKLANDIDLNGYNSELIGWLPIGNSFDMFKGNFNGAGHRITNMMTDNTSGLFGYIYGAIIDSLGIINCNITGTNYTGGLVSTSYFSTISNSYVIGNITGINYVGALVGNNNNTTITNCYTNGNIKGIGSNIGGFVGENNFSNISNCYAIENVNGNINVGGFVGENISSSIENCYVSGKIIGNNNLGGFAGINSSTITNCYFDTITTGLTIGVGNGNLTGVIGLNTNDLQISDELYTTFPSNWNFTNIWQIWDTKSYPYLKNQSAPVYNPIATINEITFEIRNETDSIMIIRHSGGNISQTYINSNINLLPLSSGIQTVDFISLAEDTLIITVYESLKNPSYSIKVRQKEIITFDPIIFIYNGLPQSPNIISTSQRVPIDTLFKLSGTPDYNYSTNIPINIGTYTMKVTLPENNLYTEITDSVDFIINPKPITIIPYCYSKIYGNTDPSEYSFTSYPVLNPNLFTGSLTRTSGDIVGTYNYEIGTLNAGTNYSLTISSLDSVFKITPKEIIVTALSGQSYYGENPENPGLSCNDLVYSEQITVLTGIYNSFNINSTTPADTYTLIVEGTLTNPNYSIINTISGTWIVKDTTINTSEISKNINKFIIYPNPIISGNDLYIEFNSEETINNSYTIEIYNNLGTIIQTIQTTNFPIKLQINHNYIPGNYFVQIKNKNGDSLTIVKILVERF